MRRGERGRDVQNRGKMEAISGARVLIPTPGSIVCSNAPFVGSAMAGGDMDDSTELVMPSVSPHSLRSAGTPDGGSGVCWPIAQGLLGRRMQRKYMLPIRSFKTKRAVALRGASLHDDVSAT